MNLIDAGLAAFRLNIELTDQCVDDLTPVDMNTIENGIKPI